MSNFTPQQIEQFLQEFFDVVGTRQYTGARYVPIFGRAGSDTVEWDDGAPYEPLTVVMHQGVSYVSRRYVPNGIQITDTDYWVETYRFNAQVEQYRQEVLGFQGQIDRVRQDMESDYVPFPDPDTYPKYGTLGQVLTTLTDGETKWEDPVVPSDAQAEAVITSWLDEHPEATTTVQDGAIKTAKLANGAVTDEKLASPGVKTDVSGLKYAVSDLCYDKTGQWEQQGIGSDGGIQNITFVASLFKVTPHYFKESFVFESYQDGYRFNVCRYTRSGDTYTFASGTALIGATSGTFDAGYYKVGFVDLSASPQNYYTMSNGQRNAAVNPLFSITMPDEAIYSRVDTLEAGVATGYLGTLDKGTKWDQQVLNANGSVANITNGAIWSKVTPTLFSDPFLFVSHADDADRFTVVRYAPVGGAYVWQEGYAGLGSWERNFPAGYYKFGYLDNTAPVQDYYNMSNSARNAAINPLFDVRTDAVAGDRFLSVENRLTELEDGLTTHKFEKPFVICSFDWYSDSWQKYQIMHETYGLNATFCLDQQTTDYGLSSGLTRDQFDTMIKNGWDFAFYGGVGERGSTEASWTAYIAGIISQKENIAIFNPVMYNTPDNASNDYITQACKNNGFLLQRAFNSTTNNYLTSPTQYQTGAIYLRDTTLQACEDAIDAAIANNCGVVFYAHNMAADADLTSATFTTFCQYLATKVAAGNIEVLTAREYAYKYLPEKAAQNDYEAQVKMYDYLYDLVQGS